MAGKTKTEEAGVGKYPERPYEKAQADPKEVEKIEDRQPDQIADYHKDHPTLSYAPPSDEESATS